jgi:hypothetical protein
MGSLTGDYYRAEMSLANAWPVSQAKSVLLDTGVNLNFNVLRRGKNCKASDLATPTPYPNSCLNSATPQLDLENILTLFKV